jgi:glycosyltransferase involved in cell wall biosynthesis
MVNFDSVSVAHGGRRFLQQTDFVANEKPAISVVTVVFNAKDLIEKTILSVLEQSYKEIEYIVIDGGSTDGTLDIIKKYEDSIDYWISEKDNGIYDAMNKAIELFSGNFIWFINAGDVIYDEHTIANIVQRSNDADVLYGDTQLIDKNGKEGLLLRSPRLISVRDFRFSVPVSHQSILIANKYVTFYDLNYRCASDHDWIIRSIGKAQKIVKINQPISRYLLGGYSENNLISCWKDKIEIVKNNFGFFACFFNYFYFANAVFKALIKKKFSNINMLTNSKKD